MPADQLPDDRQPEYIGSSEALKITGFPRSTFYRWVRKGIIPRVRAVHRWCFHRETLVAWRAGIQLPERASR